MRVLRKLLNGWRGKVPRESGASPFASSAGGESSTQQTPRRKWGLRYSLRGLLIFITLFMLWGGYHTNRSWKERAAEEVLNRRGASIEYATLSFQGSFAERVSAAYAMLVETVWQDRSASRVMLLGRLDTEAVDALCMLSHLRALTIEPSQRTHAEYSRIRSGQALPTEPMPQDALERILDNCPITELTVGCWTLSDVDCHTIASCPSVKYLAVDGSILSEKGLARLMSKPGLVWFTFGFCNATGNALANEPGSPTLEKLYCGNAPVSTELAVFVSRSPNIKELAVRQCAASDEFVHMLGPHPSLMALSLGATTVTDECLDDFVRMPSLTIVELPGLTVSPEAVARLRLAKPALQISHH
jgi:hypothetical protein